MITFTKHKMLFICLAVICLPLMFLFHFNDVYINALKDFVFTTLFCFSIIYIIIKSNEEKHLVNTLNGLDIIIQNYHYKFKN
jgi:hypothetical protein